MHKADGNRDNACWRGFCFERPSRRGNRLLLGIVAKRVMIRYDSAIRQRLLLVNSRRAETKRRRIADVYELEVS